MDKVLIVGADTAFLGILKAGLNSTGLFEVLIAGDDLQAVETLLAHPISVVAIDINTPSADCLETIAYLTQAYPATPLVLLTDYGKPWFRHKTGKNESLYHLAKPFEIRDLAAAIFVGLELRRQGPAAGGISVSSLLPLIASQRKSCRMEIRRGKSRGYLYFSQGELTDAFFPGLDSKNAAREISSWKGIAVELSDLPEAHSKTRVEADVMELAGAIWAEAGTRRDETRAHSEGAAPAPFRLDSADRAALIEAMRRCVPGLGTVEGFIGLVVFDPDGEVLLSEGGDDSVDLQRMAAELRTVVHSVSESIAAGGLGRLSAVQMEASRGRLFLARGRGETIGDCQLVALLTAAGDGAAMKMQLQNFLSRIAGFGAGNDPAKG